MIDELLQRLADLRSMCSAQAFKLAGLKSGGLAKLPGDMRLDEALEMIRLECEVGQLSMTITWPDNFSSPEIQWRLTAPRSNLDSSSLAGLVRGLAAQRLPADAVADVERQLNQRPGESAHE